MSRRASLKHLARSASRSRRPAARGHLDFRKPLVERLEQRLLLAGDYLLAATDDGEGEPADPQVVIRLVATDLSGSPITEVARGEDFLLQASVRDARSFANPAGVYAAYFDLLFDVDLVSAVASSSNALGFEIEFSEFYSNGKNGDAETPGLIDEVGSFQAGFAALGPDEIPFFQVRLTAGRAILNDDRFDGIDEDSLDVILDVLGNDQFPVGTAQIRGEPADSSPVHDVVIFSPPSVVPDSEQQFIGTQLDVVESGQNVIIEVGTPSAGGVVRIAAGGTHLIYTPAADFFGTESFSYTVSGRAQATVRVVVDPVNDAPAAVADIYGMSRNVTLEVTAERGVLANDVDVDGDALAALLREAPLHGSVTLQADGSFEYTPVQDFRGADQFTYVAHDGYLQSNEVTVIVEVGAPKVEIRLEVTDDQGRVVEHVADGDPLSLRAWVRDVRDELYPVHGVYSAYLDVLFDPARVRPVIDSGLPLGFAIAFGPDFQQAGSGDVVQPGTVNEVGTFQDGFEPLGADERLLFDMPFEVTGPRVEDDQFVVGYQSDANSLDVLTNDAELVWSVDFLADPADLSPESDVLLFEPPVVVAREDILFTGTRVDISNDPGMVIVAVDSLSAGGSATIGPDGRTIRYGPAAGFEGTETFTYRVADGSGRTAEATVVVEVVASWQNPHNPLDVNSDTVVSPIDALLVINSLSAFGARPLVEPPTGPPFYDVNGDGHVSPIDALIVINYLNDDGDGEGEPAGGDAILSGGSSDAPAWRCLDVPCLPPVLAPPVLAPRVATARDDGGVIDALIDRDGDLLPGVFELLPVSAVDRLFSGELPRTASRREYLALDALLDLLADAL